MGEASPMPKIKMQQLRKMEIILTHITTAWARIWSRKFSQPYPQHGAPLIHESTNNPLSRF